MTGTRKPSGVKSSARAAAPASDTSDLQRQLAEVREALAVSERDAEAAAVEGRARIAELVAELAAAREIPAVADAGEQSPTATNEADSLETIRDQIRDEHPELWESIRLCPLQHGLDAMIERFRA